MSKKVLVCDLDNTLYDWVGYFVPAFYAMVDEAVRITGCDREVLLDDFRVVHQRHHDSEHPFSLLETATIKRLFPQWPRSEVAKALDSAFHAFNTERKQRLALYPGVVEALGAVRDAGIVVLAHTESKLYAVMERLARFGLTEYFEHIYCRERSESLHPNSDAAACLLNDFPLARVVEMSQHQRKPDPTVLLEICRRNEVHPSRAAYVGDSIARDILMARRAGVTSIWAKYGTYHDPRQYEMLVRITHWTPADVACEAEFKAQAAGLKPDYTLETGFPEIISILDMD